MNALPNSSKRQCPSTRESRRPENDTPAGVNLPSSVVGQLNFFSAFSRQVPFFNLMRLEANTVRLLNSPVGADLIILVENVHFFAHLCILSLRTSYFNAPLKNEHEREHLAELGAKPRKVTLLGHSAPAFWRFLTWCYTGDYSPYHARELPPFLHGGMNHRAGAPSAGAERCIVQDNGALVININVYFLADALHIPALETLAAQAQEQIMMMGWSNVPFAQETMLGNFPMLAKRVYEVTARRDDQMRGVLVRYAVTNHQRLVPLPEFMGLMVACADFAMDFTRTLSNVYTPKTPNTPALSNLNSSSYFPQGVVAATAPKNIPAQQFMPQANLSMAYNMVHETQGFNMGFIQTNRTTHVAGVGTIPGPLALADRQQMNSKTSATTRPALPRAPSGMESGRLV